MGKLARFALSRALQKGFTMCIGRMAEESISIFKGHSCLEVNQFMINSFSVNLPIETLVGKMNL